MCKVEKVMFLHVETHKYLGLELFHDSECAALFYWFFS